MGGIGKYSETETDLTTTVEKRGLFKKLAELFGFDVVEKGEVKERYEKSVKRDNFWNAFYSLQDTLLKYNWENDRGKFETDEGVIREALTEFSEIVIDVLAAPNIVKALSENAPVEKSGKKISGKNRGTLQSIYDNLGALLEEFAEEKEESEVTKTEVQTIVDESIKKALEGVPAHNAEETPAAEPALTAEAVEKMVAEAVWKALEPKDEAMTAEAVQKMVTEAVAKAVEPVYKVFPQFKSGGLRSRLSAVDGDKRASQFNPPYHGSRRGNE